MELNLETLSRSQLEAIRSQVEGQIKSVEAKSFETALEATRVIAATHGYTLAELVEAAPKLASKRPRLRENSPFGANVGLFAGQDRLPPKYRDPLNAANTWSGAGRRPLWFKEAIGAGHTIDDLMIRDAKKADH